MIATGPAISPVAKLSMRALTVEDVALEARPISAPRNAASLPDGTTASLDATSPKFRLWRRVSRLRRHTDYRPSAPDN